MNARQTYIIVLGVIVLTSMAITAVVIIKGYTRSDGIIAIGAFALGALATLAHNAANDRPRRMIWPDDIPPKEEPTIEIQSPLYDHEEEKRDG